MLNLETLNNDFAIAAHVRFVTGAGGFVMIEVNNDHATALISTYSGHVLSYKENKCAEPLLFVSEQANYEQGKAIRGGVPVCWPWFSDDGVPAHGFVRDQQWNVAATQQQLDGSTKIILNIGHNQHSQEIWQYKFNLQLEIIVGETLSMALTTSNLDEQDFTISQALHSYLAVGDVNEIEIIGLDGTHYLDKTTGFGEGQQQGNISIDGEFDRIYGSLQHNVLLRDPVFNRQIRISSPKSTTAVIWNPGPAKSIEMTDLADNDYKKFICIEAANTACDKVVVKAGHSHCLTVNYAIEALA
ncbi:MAG: D-hexose-6-phosphate mutarotase [Piscirickettsiaceae bacterium]|nr:D-hexose-6-phosphate mutarotase [Piscirickettsiaceae bacterium]